MYKEKPDLYGPFWIYTTLIIMIAISGNLSRYFQIGRENFTYKYEFIPAAATIVFTMGLGLPLVLKLLMRFLGSNFFDGTYIEVSNLTFNQYVSSFLDYWYICLFIYKLSDNYHIVCSAYSGFAMDFHCLFSLCFHKFPHGYILERFEQKQFGWEEKINSNSIYMCSTVSFSTHIQTILL